MSIHRSLKVKSNLLRARNVWTRLERIQKLEEDGKIEEGRSVFALPKVRTRFKVKSVKAAKAAAAEGSEVEGAEAEAEGTEEKAAK